MKERGRGGGGAPLWLWLSAAISCAAAGKRGSGGWWGWWGWCGRVYAKLWSPVCWGWSLSSVELKCCCASREECSPFCGCSLALLEALGQPSCRLPGRSRQSWFFVISLLFLIISFSSWNFFRQNENQTLDHLYRDLISSLVCLLQAQVRRAEISRCAKQRFQRSVARRGLQRRKADSTLWRVTASCSLP